MVYASCDDEGKQKVAVGPPFFCMESAGFFCQNLCQSKKRRRESDETGAISSVNQCHFISALHSAISNGDLQYWNNNGLDRILSSPLFDW